MDKSLKLFAFWPYNYSYCTGIMGFLGGEVKAMKENGAVYIPNYQGWFQPKKLLPVEEGKKVLAKLEELREQYERAHDAVNKEFQARVDAILK